jgi:Ca2+/H+ antiporter, TMEM165/GDT1 family
MSTWSTIAPAITAAFLASLVEVVEAFTIVLAVATVRGWRVALSGAACGLALLALIILIFGPAIDRVPLGLLQVAIGLLLLLFGLRWLRKAVLRAAGVIALHDEEAAFRKETSDLTDRAQSQQSRADWLAGLAAFKAVVVEGIEVVFIVLAVGAGRGLIAPASLGALAAAALVVVLGALIRRPLARVPENALKFGVGVMLSAFGVFWTGEGLGVRWPGDDFAVLAFVAMFVACGLGLVALLRRPSAEVVR